MKIIGKLLVLAVVLGIAPLCFADSINTWTLQNVTFTDGATATGSFVFDSTNKTIVSYDIDVSGGNTSVFPNFVFQNGAPNNTGAFLVGTGNLVLNFTTDVTSSLSLFPDGLQFRLTFAITDLPAAGGTVQIDLTNGLQGECFNCNPFRALASGFVTTTPSPEPASLALLATGMLGLAGAVRWKLS